MLLKEKGSDITTDQQTAKCSKHNLNWGSAVCIQLSLMFFMWTQTIF